MERQLDLILSKGIKSQTITKAVELPESYLIPMGNIYDQGSSSMCAVYALADLMERAYNVKGSFNKNELYELRSTKDGMMLSELFSLAKEHGFTKNDRSYKVHEYFRVGTSNDIQKAIVSMFGVIIGMPVYNYGPSFWLGDRLFGYHAVPLIGYGSKGFIIKNSWGVQWANNGITTLPFEEVEGSVMEAWAFI